MNYFHFFPLQLELSVLLYTVSEVLRSALTIEDTFFVLGAQFDAGGHVPVTNLDNLGRSPLQLNGLIRDLGAGLVRPCQHYWDIKQKRGIRL